jgi:hypothetical protein
MVGKALEGAMIIQSIVTTFVLVFALIAAFGHVLLLQAMFAPKQRPAQAQANEQPSRHAVVAAVGVTA